MVLCRSSGVYSGAAWDYLGRAQALCGVIYSEMYAS